MYNSLPPLRLTGATTLRDGALVQRSVGIADGRFTRGPLPAIDLSGYLILPGIVDLHCSALDLPGRTGAADPEQSLAMQDQLAASQGVTTRHLCHPWSWEHPAATPSAASHFARAFAAYRPRARTDLHLQLRCETHLVDEGDALLRLITETGLDLIMFSDRVAEADDLRQRDAQAFGFWCWARGISTSDAEAALHHLRPLASQVPRHLCGLAEAFDTLGVIYGSIGDRSAEAREHFSMIGARLCLAPRTARVAAAARAVGDPVVAPAGDLLQQDGAAGRARTMDLIQAGLADALASAGQPQAMAMAPFILANAGVMPLARAWALVSERPAHLLRMPDRGIIAQGRRADLTIIHAQSRQVEATIAGGRLTYLNGGAAQRFLLAGLCPAAAAE